MKRILTIQDLSCVGRCSLTVALPVLSAMGHNCCVLPTAVLSTHTGFPAPHVRDLTGDLDAILAHWHGIGVTFDAISIGYLSDPAQAEAVKRILDAFPEATVVLDPVMGDHGKLYSRITNAHVDALRQLCTYADHILPNVTEAAALTGLPYREQADKGYLTELIQAMLRFTKQSVIITGGSCSAGKTGFAGASKEIGDFHYQAPLIPRQFHGTGDLFSAVFTGGIARSEDVVTAVTKAAQFVERCIAATEEVTPYGVAFESQLPYLFP